MLDGGSSIRRHEMTHSGFILAAFGMTFLVVAGLVVSILLDHRTLKRDLARLDPDHQRG